MSSVAFDNRLSSGSGIWFFLIAELILFGLLFIFYLVYRITDAQAFHFAAGELSVFSGTVGAVILLVSSAVLAGSVTAVKQEKKRLALQLLGMTFLLGIIFLVARCLEWRVHIKAQIFPGSPVLALRGPGDLLFYGFYFFITGLHALHVIIGLAVIGFLFRGFSRGKIGSGDYPAYEKGVWYWHLVVLLGILIFPVFYLIT
ncbi:MAG: cytochrome c oxidase subunit 3 family protein [Bacteroidales bacterium]|jgi:cytochrome c oxidase subunit 3|nr:cytochrome c oxidase subunit 3 family protein [Bacteroidales bacterium]HPM18763.1 cytochrome c oxidase subunit 3 [Bacteroidales bacterium]HQG77801.1 cytochrome c oxidase subunit 3 [Bacteroidales bacterium]